MRSFWFDKLEYNALIAAQLLWLDQLRQLDCSICTQSGCSLSTGVSFFNTARSEHYLLWSQRHVHFAEVVTVRRVLLLLDRHRKPLPQAVCLAFVACFPYDSHQLPRQRLLVVLSSEERNRLARSPTTPCPADPITCIIRLVHLSNEELTCGRSPQPLGGMYN